MLNCLHKIFLLLNLLNVADACYSYCSSFNANYESVTNACYIYQDYNALAVKPDWNQAKIDCDNAFGGGGRGDLIIFYNMTEFNATIGLLPVGSARVWISTHKIIINKKNIFFKE